MVGTLPTGAPRKNQGHGCTPCPIHLGLVGVAGEGALSVLSPLPKEETVGAGTCPRSLRPSQSKPCQRRPESSLPVDSKFHVATSGSTEEGSVGGIVWGLEPNRLDLKPGSAVGPGPSGLSSLGLSFLKCKMGIRGVTLCL